MMLMRCVMHEQPVMRRLAKRSASKSLAFRSGEAGKTASAASGPPTCLLLDIYNVHGDRREALLTLARQAKERGWWQSYASAIPDWFAVYVGLEAEAARISEYAAELVPGLLQTPEYYRAFLRAAPAAGSEEEISRKIEVRTARQERLTGDDPPEYWAVLNEAVIRRAVGGTEAMRAQLHHIAERAGLPT